MDAAQTLTWVCLGREHLPVFPHLVGTHRPVALSLIDPGHKQVNSLVACDCWTWVGPEQGRSWGHYQVPTGWPRSTASQAALAGSSEPRHWHAGAGVGGGSTRGLGLTSVGSPVQKQHKAPVPAVGHLQL